MTWVSPRLSWEAVLPTSLGLHLATVFYLSPVRVFDPPSYRSAAYRTHWGAPHGGLWGSQFSGFSALILSLKPDECTFWFFLDLCCVSSSVGNLSRPPCIPALCTAVSFHLGEVPGNESFLPLTSINISPYPFITEQLQSIRTATGKLSLVGASTGGMKFVTGRSVDQYEKIKHIFPSIWSPSIQNTVVRTNVPIIHSAFLQEIFNLKRLVSFDSEINLHFWPYQCDRVWLPKVNLKEGQMNT